MGEDMPLLVAVDGRCGSGKTTLGEYLKQKFECNLFRMDDFFLREEQRTPERLAEIGGNVDYERFRKTVLVPVVQKRPVLYQPFSCQQWKLLEAYWVPYKKLNIIEGSYSMHPYFENPYQLRIFMNISPEDQIANIIRRNGQEKAKEFGSMVTKGWQGGDMALVLVAVITIAIIGFILSVVLNKMEKVVCPWNN